MVKNIITNFTVEQITLILASATLIITSFFYLITFKLTKKGLNQNKNQFTNQLSLANQQFDKQQNTIRVQQFENTFFNMINLQQEITDGLNLLEASGRNTFQYFFEQDCLVLNSQDEAPRSGQQIIKDEGIKGYEEIDYLPVFDHYFRHLYNIFKFIDESTFLDSNSKFIDNRYRYARILRATLSPYELVLVFYNCRSKYGNGPFKNLVEKYSVLNNLRDEFLDFSPFDDNATFKPIENDYDRFQTTDKYKVTESVYYYSAFKKDASLFKYNE